MGTGREREYQVLVERASHSIDATAPSNPRAYKSTTNLYQENIWEYALHAAV